MLCLAGMIQALPPVDNVKPLVARTDSTESFSKLERPIQQNQGQLIQAGNGVLYSTTHEGIYLTLSGATSSVKLFALTGQLIWSGDLVRGKFFIPTGAGIFFLRINNKSYKIICK